MGGSAGLLAYRLLVFRVCMRRNHAHDPQTLPEFHRGNGGSQRAIHTALARSWQCFLASTFPLLSVSNYHLISSHKQCHLHHENVWLGFGYE